MFVVKKFLENESGAVTVDWVVLVSGLVGLGFAVVTTLSPAVSNGVDDIAATLANASARLPIVVSFQTTITTLSGGYCYWEGGCVPWTQEDTSYYQDADGNEYVHTVITVDGTVTSDVWTDSNGDEVDPSLINIV